MTDILAPNLANAITAFATILSGVIPLLFCALTKSQIAAFLAGML